MGNGKIRPPHTQNPHPLTDTKNLPQVIRSVIPTATPYLVQIRPCGASGQMGEI